MAVGKWIDHLRRDTVIDDAARMVLQVRLEVVREFLPLALHKSDEDLEYVHQLRVGTRRAAAAVDIFAACMPPASYKLARRHLRRLRRAAGDARDWDVLLAGLLHVRSSRPTSHRPGLEMLAGYALGQRSAAQAKLLESSREHPNSIGKLHQQMVDAIRAPHDSQTPATLFELANPLLSALAAELETACQGDSTDYGQLHRIRILGKRLRYAMEVFASCYGPSYREVLYPRVETMQEILGRANDCHVALTRLENLRERTSKAWPAPWQRWRAGVNGQITHHQEQLAVERRRFVRWWKQWKKAECGGAFRQLSGE